MAICLVYLHGCIWSFYDMNLILGLVSAQVMRACIDVKKLAHHSLCSKINYYQKSMLYQTDSAMKTIV